MNQAMAQTALWATLALHRGFFTYGAQQRAGRWLQQGQRRADEVPVLVLGFGQMGRTVARALVRQGYPVAAWRRGAAPAQEPIDPALADVTLHSGAAALAAALPRAQVLVNLLPLTPDTRGLLDARLLARLPRGAGLVNLARGAHLVDDDLLAALASGQVGHAVLDVFHAEPLPAAHPFWRHPQVTVLPHVAALTDARSAAAAVARNIEALARHAPLQHVVQRQAGY
jgi:glyoxylate/hydroxypyruvate reductase A